MKSWTNLLFAAVLSVFSIQISYACVFLAPPLRKSQAHIPTFLIKLCSGLIF